jgi:hypothetical protein
VGDVFVNLVAGIALVGMAALGLGMTLHFVRQTVIQVRLQKKKGTQGIAFIIGVILTCFGMFITWIAIYGASNALNGH